MAGPESAHQATIDWRRVAADKNVAIDVARVLWEQAKAAMPSDEVGRSNLFRRLIEDAAKNPAAAKEPGRQTLVDAKGPADPTSLGPGKTTQVLLDQNHKANNPAPAPEPGTVAAPGAGAATAPDGKKAEESPAAPPTVAKLHHDMVAAAQAGQAAIAQLATADPVTIVEALRQVRAGAPTLLQKIINVLGTAIERRLGDVLPDPEKKPDGPPGISVPIVGGDGEIQTHAISEADVPMMADQTISAKVADWRAEIVKRSPADQHELAPKLSLATSLDTIAGGQAKKAKLGDEPAKAALPDTQKALAATLGTIARRVHEPTQKPSATPAPPTATADAVAARAHPGAPVAPTTPAEHAAVASTPTTEPAPSTQSARQPASSTTPTPASPSASSPSVATPASAPPTPPVAVSAPASAAAPSAPATDAHATLSTPAAAPAAMTAPQPTTSTTSAAIPTTSAQTQTTQIKEDEAAKSEAKSAAKPTESPMVSKHSAGPAPSGWQANAVGQLPSTAVAPDDPGHTYHLLNDNTAVAASDPRSLADAQTQALKAQLARIRGSTPGKVRDEAELSSADVALSMNDQLQKINPGEVDAMVGKFSPADQERVRIVLARSSGFGRMEGMNSLRDALQPQLAAGKKLFTPGRGSLADNVAYVASKGSFTAYPGKIKTTTTIEMGTAVILDEVVLSMIRSDKTFAKSLHDNHAVLLEPRGFTDGINMFNAGSPELIEQRTQRVLDRAKAIVLNSGNKMPFEDAVTVALDETTKQTLEAAGLSGQLQVVDPATHATTSEAIADQLNGDAGITAAQLDAVLAKADEADRASLRELLVQQAEIFSPRRISNDLLSMHQQNMSIAAQHFIKPENVYYFIHLKNKSFGMMAMAHREATGTPVDRYLDGEADLKSRNLRADTMVIVLDDVAGSGISLKDASGDASKTGYPGQIVVSPMISTQTADQRFNGPGGIASTSQNTTYVPQKLMQALKESSLYQGLPVARQKHLLTLLESLNFGEGTSIAFPYMAPDNNNRMFAADLAKEFIVNKNQDASKSDGDWNAGKP